MLHLQAKQSLAASLRETDESVQLNSPLSSVRLSGNVFGHNALFFWRFPKGASLCTVRPMGLGQRAFKDIHLIPQSSSGKLNTGFMSIYKPL